MKLTLPVVLQKTAGVLYPAIPTRMQVHPITKHDAHYMGYFFIDIYLCQNH